MGGERVGQGSFAGKIGEEFGGRRVKLPEKPPQGKRGARNRILFDGQSDVESCSACRLERAESFPQSTGTGKQIYHRKLRLE